MNFDHLIGLLKDCRERCKESERDTVAKLGAKKGDIAKLERNGEYHGIAIEFLEDVKRLLTDIFVEKILRLLKKEEYLLVMNLLEITNPDQIYYILHKWFEFAVHGYDGSLKVYEKEYPQFDKWIISERSDPLPGKIKIVEIGQNTVTGESVVPPDWLGKEFKNGEELHLAMDQLISRLGKPPVTYAIIYSMIKQKINTIVHDLSNIKYNRIFYVKLADGKIQSVLSSDPKKGYTYVVYGKIVVGFILTDILTDKLTTSNNSTVGVLISRLQKSIRRGRYARKILEETILALSVAPNYNLPEHNFLRVSASKQLVWRLFISILEDCRPYKAVDELSLLDLILLTLITNRCLEYHFTEQVIKLITKTAVNAQFNDTPDDAFNWKNLDESGKTPINEKSTFHTAISLALSNIIMMGGDQRMLKKLYSSQEKMKTFAVPTQYFHDEYIYRDTLLSSIDHHCVPHIILYYQACIESSMSTKEISAHIWNQSSSYNVRIHKVPFKKDETLRIIQNYLLDKPKKSRKFTSETQYQLKSTIPDLSIKRSTFLILFGEKYKYNGSDTILNGSLENPVRIKINGQWEYENNKNIINQFPMKIINLFQTDPPKGYKWVKEQVTISAKNGLPHIDGKAVPFFDGSKVITSSLPLTNTPIREKINKLIIKIFSGQKIKFSTLIKLRSKTISGLVEWVPKNQVNINLVILTYIKIFNQFDNIITVGPVDRMGHKVANSINYVYEGRLWAIFNFLCYLYPDTLKPHGNLNFVINKMTNGYTHLVKSLETMIFANKYPTKGIVPKIVTPLWDHQTESVTRIVTDFNKGYHGKGDASDVGSGKTLTSLGVAVELMKNDDPNYSGILVMLPGNKLIQTWKDEIEKHTKGFDVKFQGNNSDIGSIQKNTIVITTMGRIRDHPIIHRWLLVIIDECLSVQNKNALQTEESWKQSMISSHILLMSATFFRTRFDKLYYMLKMLQSNLPENRAYLDTILLESIVSKISSVKREWEINTHYFELDNVSRKEYDKIMNKDLSTEIKYAKLNSYLVNSDTVKESEITQIKHLIKSLEKNHHGCVIYTRSKEEAKSWSDSLKIPIYPEKGKHTIITYHDGTYGLNDLIIYDTIIMRPMMTPDKIDQIKGRIDRPGQKSNNLRMEYFILKDTIDEGLLIRMRLCSQFVKNYIMPLSKFYDISVNYEKY